MIASIINQVIYFQLKVMLGAWDPTSETFKNLKIPRFSLLIIILLLVVWISKTFIIYMRNIGIIVVIG